MMLLAGYVCFIMALNCVAFGIIVSCYMKMYCSIRGSQAWNSNDFRVAKRMALLVFTDFACWAPIAFFSLTAAFGYDLISLNDAKVCTPFLFDPITSRWKVSTVIDLNCFSANNLMDIETNCPGLRIR